MPLTPPGCDRPAVARGQRRAQAVKTPRLLRQLDLTSGLRAARFVSEIQQGLGQPEPGVGAPQQPTGPLGEIDRRFE